ncbi:DUF1287 domain-containing protein [Pseudogemmobacter humi]|uniref:DUF1287 domain-containing protein n=1 Tax=Pseudogemmobacter humi TaxID=2483812 RepID=A0A3P5XMT9_9RHOB|nr:DUF1287 domain-containing protein [Pseudogemmobacter humi]VDC33038.1 hypothetical protein XINFAN_03584 [Pseudogemmobacter humi]
MSAETGRRGFLALALTPLLPRLARADEPGERIAAAAEAQVGVVTLYDPAYVALDFPGGDVAPERGVCTDVLVRALRVAERIDLQAAVNADMKADFAAYPALWGLKRTDRNIDHRRVPNLRRLLERTGADLPGDADFLPGDVITCTIPGDLAHLMIVANARAGGRQMIVHNIGRGTQVEDRLEEFPRTGHYRLSPPVLDRLRRLSA